MEKGLSSGLTEVRAVVLYTLTKVAKSAGPLLAPHLGVLIPALLEATGEMEGTKLNYISTRLGVDQGIQERLDSARMAASRSTPTMECVNYVLQFVNSPEFTTLSLQPYLTLSNWPAVCPGAMQDRPKAEWSTEGSQQQAFWPRGQVFRA